MFILCPDVPYRIVIAFYDFIPFCSNFEKLGILMSCVYFHLFFCKHVHDWSLLKFSSHGVHCNGCVNTRNRDDIELKCCCCGFFGELFQTFTDFGK